MAEYTPTTTEFEYYNALVDAGHHTREALADAIDRQPADALLLSGGLDSSILAALDPNVRATTVQVEDQGTDIAHAQQAAEYLGINWHPIVISREQAVDSFPELVRIHNSYDLALLNDVAVLHGIRYLRSLGDRAIRTGDGADMTFCGYSYLFNDNRRDQLVAEYPYMKPASRTIGEHHDAAVSNPFLDRRVLDVALSLPDEMLYRSFDGVHRPATQWWKKLSL